MSIHLKGHLRQIRINFNDIWINKMDLWWGAYIATIQGLSL